MHNPKLPNIQTVLLPTVYAYKHMCPNTWPSKKLTEKYLGPFELIAQVGSISFTLRLSNSMRSIHPVFHTSMLEPSTPNQFHNQTQNHKPLIIINSNSEYEISEILNSCIDKQCKCKLLYLVEWVGYEGTDEETSWLPASKLGHASKVISDFHQAYPSRPGPLPLVESWCFHAPWQFQKKSFFNKFQEKITLFYELFNFHCLLLPFSDLWLLWLFSISVSSTYLISHSNAATILSSASLCFTISETNVSISLTMWTWNE